MLGLKLPILLAVIALMVVLRVRRVGILAWTLAWLVAIALVLKFGFIVPIPGSVVMLYMAIVAVALFAYVTSSRERQAQFVRPILRLVLEPQYKMLLVLVVVLLPVLVAFNVYMQMSVPVQAPAFGRTVHPAPPAAVTVHETPIDLARTDNPYRHLEKDDPEAFRAHIENGRRVYFENCFYCHGDAMAGDGMFAHGLNPIPSNFTDPGVIPMLQESFLFWRISKGGPGLPEEGGPWDTAMPAWEEFLSIEEMWDVVLFLYDYTNFRPRALEEHH